MTDYNNCNTFATKNSEVSECAEFNVQLDRQEVLLETRLCRQLTALILTTVKRVSINIFFRLVKHLLYKLLVTQPDFIYLDVLISIRDLRQKKLVQFFYWILQRQVWLCYEPLIYKVKWVDEQSLTSHSTSHFREGEQKCIMVYHASYQTLPLTRPWSSSSSYISDMRRFSSRALSAACSLSSNDWLPSHELTKITNYNNISYWNNTHTINW